MNDYTKLSSLVGGTFTITKMNGYKWKMWDNVNKKMLVSDTWEKDYRKIYTAETDKGILDLSASQTGILLETVMRNGQADLNGRTFQVKSNGKTGMDIRYFFNVVQDNHSGIDQTIKAELVTDSDPHIMTKKETTDDLEIDDINLDDIVF
jgi:hypothetical protein